MDPAHHPDLPANWTEEQHAYSEGRACTWLEVQKRYKAAKDKWRPLRNRTEEDREWLFIKEFEAYLFHGQDPDLLPPEPEPEPYVCDQCQSSTGCDCCPW